MDQKIIVNIKEFALQVWYAIVIITFGGKLFLKWLFGEENKLRAKKLLTIIFIQYPIKVKNRMQQFYMWIKPYVIHIFNAIKATIIKVTVIIYKIVKATLIALCEVMMRLIFGCVTAIYDQFVTKKHDTQHNIGQFLASAIVIGGIAYSGITFTHATTSFASTVFTNPTLTAKQKTDVTKAIQKLDTQTKTWKKEKAQVSSKSILPNGDYMPVGVKYIDAKTLSTNYQKNVKSIKIVDKLFINPTTKGQIFLNKIAQGAQIAAKSYGVNPSVIMAQAYVESGVGQSTLASKYNNYFGVKYRGFGQKVALRTNEETKSGQVYTITDNFQVYGNIAESMSDNARLIRNGIRGQKDRYSGAWVENTKSYQDATKALTGTYATATQYNIILNKVIQAYGLYVLDNHTAHNPDLTKSKSQK